MGVPLLARRNIDASIPQDATCALRCSFTASRQVENNSLSAITSTRISMLKAARLARPVALLLALALFAACNSDQQSGVAALTVEATPRQIDGQVRVSLLSVETRDAKGEPGTGVVTLAASGGTFSDGTTQTTLTLANGLAGIGYLCNANTDRNSAGQIRIDASWGRLNYALILNV